MDLDAVADELYALPPAEFTAARDARAAEAVRDGDRPLAERIKGLRKPTLSAWASNLLIRARPDEAEPLLELGEALRDAYRNVDGAQLRTLSAQQRQVTAALARQARRLAAEAGQPIGNQALQEVQETLHAALADPEAARAWASGRLTRPLGAAGFPAAAAATGEASEGKTRTGTSRPGKRGTAAAGKRGSAQPTDLDRARARREQRARTERARQALRDAEEAFDAAEQARAEHQRHLDDAVKRNDRAARQAADLAERLAAAQDEHRATEGAVRDARADLKDAERGVREADTELRRARRDLERIDPDGGDA